MILAVYDDRLTVRGAKSCARGLSSFSAPCTLGQYRCRQRKIARTSDSLCAASCHQSILSADCWPVE